jgi:hypothetical protein
MARKKKTVEATKTLKVQMATKQICGYLVKATFKLRLMSAFCTEDVILLKLTKHALEEAYNNIYSETKYRCYIFPPELKKRLVIVSADTKGG